MSAVKIWIFLIIWARHFHCQLSISSIFWRFHKEFIHPSLLHLYLYLVTLIHCTLEFLIWAVFRESTQICWISMTISLKVSGLIIVDFFWFAHRTEWHASHELLPVEASLGCDVGIPPTGDDFSSDHIHSLSTLCSQAYITDNIYRLWVNVYVCVCVNHSGWVFIWKRPPSPEIGLL